MEDWKKHVIRENKYAKGEGTLELYFFQHREKVNDDGVEEVITGMTQEQRDKVRYIHLYECKQITDAALRIIGEHIRHLARLHLRYCVEVTDEGIAAVLRNNPNIKVLTFSECEKATSVSIDTVIEYCPDIEELHARSVGLTSLPGNIGNLSKLKTLNLRGNIITTLPLSIGALQEDCILFIDGNPIKNVPPSVLETKDEGKAIIRFLSDALNGAAESNQFKMVLLGTGEAGKTSLLNALMGRRKPLTTKEQRTIHVEIRQFELKQSNNALPPVTIKAYDFGGQETYALGQSQYFDNNGIYILVINADETNAQVFVAHLQRLQAMAPNAVILVVLSKVDILTTEKALQDKLKWVQSAIQNFNENTNAATPKDNHTGPRPIPAEIITVTVQDEPEMARMLILSSIQNLLDTKSSMFPSVGMKLPITWLEAMSFIEALRLHGSGDKNKKELDTKMKEFQARDAQRTADAMNKKTNSVMQSESEAGIWNYIQDFFMFSIGGYDDSTNKDLFKFNDGYDDSANKDLPGYDEPLHPYIRKENLSRAWIEYAERNNTSNKDQDGVKSVLDDVLDLLKAQGDIIIYGDLVLLDPAFSAFVMKAFTNHTMTINELESDQFKQYVTDNNLSSDACGKLRISFAKLIDHGHLRSDVLKYLLRRLPIDTRDYDLIIQMLVETFAIFLSSNQTDSTSQIVHDPVLLFRLPKHPDFGVIKKHWPKECGNRHQLEIRFEFLYGCPASLAGRFAASIHSLGIYLSAYINGALILMEENKSLIYARLEKENGKSGGSLSLAIRSRSENLNNVDKAIVWKMVNFLEQEQNEKYPGLIYAIEVLCPSCIKNNGTESAYHWNQDGDASILCTSCYEILNMKKMFGDRTQFTQQLNGSAVGSKNNNTATQIVGHILGKRHVLLSARFNPANKLNEAKARELAQELRNIGVNVYMVDVGVGETFGDKTNFALTHMDAMICFCTFDYGENTISPHSSFGELNHARENRIPYVPIKMCKGWPPKPPPDYDGNNKGLEQNNVAFKNDLLYLDWYDKVWDAKNCAEEVKAALRNISKFESVLR
jgi:GTPase SAR1 family protein